ncbi:MAG: hypothetical protein D6746_15000 [Bacteroidetes bacterium]|nr:MAG: hypothetical protein D6746_15000 [Bacteroidota bacterium]
MQLASRLQKKFRVFVKTVAVVFDKLKVQSGIRELWSMLDLCYYTCRRETGGIGQNKRFFYPYYIRGFRNAFDSTSYEGCKIAYKIPEKFGIFLCDSPHIYLIWERSCFIKC